ncbi:MAG TPA: tetratricopeptide repeat-containing protein [Cyanobacteria bacterium UBA8553]|nr:tetratricopeptide repeat-containing protein [Cyanobacteria bacterium UBA8553]HAJ60056.1 tetratricopeptide repeat-containing protein [Cyanobacteria bacterium UBA8543]
MLKDAQGLEVTTDSSEAIASINRFVNQILSYSNNPDGIFTAIEADPTSVLANAYAATVYMLGETAEGPAQAAPYLKTAYEHFDQANEREQLYLHGINTWVNGDIDQAMVYHEEIANQYPRDLLSVQIGQKHYLDLGKKAELLQIAQKVLPVNRENHYIYGMLAFGLEENQRYEEAEAAGRQATEIDRNDPWAHHAMAHVLYSQRRLDEGIAWTQAMCDTWKDSGLYTHHWWHTALYYVDQEDFEKVLELYDTRIWGTDANQETALDLINAISILMRLELSGVDVAPSDSKTSRWEEVVNVVCDRIHEHVLAFYDLHYIYALVRVGRDELVDQMLKSIQSHAQNVKPCLQKAWKEVTIPATQGMVAYAKGEWATAAKLLGSALPRLHEMGGSDAQRDVFEQVYLDCLIRAEEINQARQLLEKRAAAGENIPSTCSRESNLLQK